MPLTEKQKHYIEKHYADALRIGAFYKSAILSDFEKEDIAVRALFKAAEAYNDTVRGFEGKVAKFSTFLMTIIMRDISRYNIKRHRQLGHMRICPQKIFDEHVCSTGCKKYWVPRNTNGLDTSDITGGNVQSSLTLPKEQALFDGLDTNSEEIVGRLLDGESAEEILRFISENLTNQNAKKMLVCLIDRNRAKVEYALDVPEKANVSQVCSVLGVTRERGRQYLQKIRTLASLYFRKNYGTSL